MPTKNKEQYTISGDKLVATVKKLVKEGNARKIIVKNEKGKKLIEFPVTIGAVGVIAAPVVAALGACAALINKCSIVVERGTSARGKKNTKKTSK